MASKHFLVFFGLSLVILNSIIQSAPIENVKQSVQSSSGDNKQAVNEPRLKSLVPEKTSSTSPPTTTTTTAAVAVAAASPEKKKRSTFIDQLDVPMDEENDYLNDDDDDDDDQHHVLHANIQEKSAQIHDNADKPVDTDDSRVYSDIQMTPLNLKNIFRRRREIRLNDPSGQRRKRALSPYDFDETDSFYDPYAYLIEQQEYDRPSRSFAPLYWYPNVYERNIRSALAPSYYESSDLPQLYSSFIDGDEDENSDVILDDEDDYESNRYPILIPASNVALNNYELQQQYNADDLPLDEDFETDLDDGDDVEQYGLFNSNERPYYARYNVPEIIF